jgi:hypothetical protein
MNLDFAEIGFLCPFTVFLYCNTTVKHVLNNLYMGRIYLSVCAIGKVKVKR